MGPDYSYNIKDHWNGVKYDFKDLKYKKLYYTSNEYHIDFNKYLKSNLVCIVNKKCKISENNKIKILKCNPDILHDGYKFDKAKYALFFKIIKYYKTILYNKLNTNINRDINNIISKYVS